FRSHVRLGSDWERPNTRIRATHDRGWVRRTPTLGSRANQKAHELGLERARVRRGHEVDQVGRELTVHGLLMAEGLEPLARMIVAHTAVADAAKREVVLGDMDDGVVDRQPAR